MLNLHKRGYAKPLLYCHCEAVDALIYPINANNMCTKQFAIVWRENHLYGHRHSPWVVIGVRVGVYGRCQIGGIKLFKALCGHTSRCYRDIKHLGYGSAYRAFILGVIAKYHIIRSYSCLPICWPCKQVEPGFVEQRMLKLHRITHSIDTFGRGLHKAIDADATHLAKRNICLTRKSGCGAHTDTENNDVGRNCSLGAENDIYPITATLECHNALAQI